MARYGRLAAEQAPGARPGADHHRPPGAGGDPALQEGRSRWSARGSTRTPWRCTPRERGQIKQVLLKLGWPAEDLAGYVDGEAHPIELDEDGWPLRPYQQQAVEGFWHGGSGVVVLPCGAGKTLVGAGAMAQAKATTLILVTNTVSARQWKHELVKRTSLTEEEIGEYSGTRKEIRPVTIATYQVLTTRRKGVYPHLELFDSRDWGLIVYDEVHLLPAPVFKFTADLQARRRLGLTATLVREDGRESRRLLADRAQALRRAVEGDRGAGLHRARPTASRCGSTSPTPSGCAYATAEAGGEVPLLRDHRDQAQGHRGAGRASTRGEQTLVIGQYIDQLDELGEHLDAPVIKGETTQRAAREALRGVPAGRDLGAGRLQGGELLHRPARGDGRHPGVRHVRLPPGGGPAARPGAAAEGGRARGALLLGGRPRHRRPGLRRAPAAVPGRAGVRLPDHRRGRRCSTGDADAVARRRRQRVAGLDVERPARRSGPPGVAASADARLLTARPGRPPGCAVRRPRRSADRARGIGWEVGPVPRPRRRPSSRRAESTTSTPWPQTRPRAPLPITCRECGPARAAVSGRTWETVVERHHRTKSPVRSTSDRRRKSHPAYPPLGDPGP